ncbi:MAG: alpha/beta hydrolase [Coriobacteriales bacterium]|jgi:acetyl esterase/lipase|nr:alpha/beta hydrolase [Coriobacteriales bacterium]
MTKLSLIYRAEMRAIRRFGHLNVFALDETRMRRWLNRYGVHQPRGVPKFVRVRHRVTRQTIAGCPCPCIEPRGGWQEGDPVVLFLHGGGLIFEALPVHWMAASKIVRSTGARVVFPAYPLLPKATIYESSDAVLEVYRHIRTLHASETITVLGDSSGAALAVMLTHTILRHEPELGVPRQLILASPPQAVVDDPLVRARMEAQQATDAMIPFSLLGVLEALMPVREGRDSYYATPLEGSFDGFPPTTILSGTAEVFYPLMEGFISRLRAANVSVTYYPGTDLCHVYPYIPAAREGQAGLAHIIKAIAQKM